MMPKRKHPVDTTIMKLARRIGPIWCRVDRIDSVASKEPEGSNEHEKAKSASRAASDEGEKIEKDILTNAPRSLSDVAVKIMLARTYAELGKHALKSAIGDGNESLLAEGEQRIDLAMDALKQTVIFIAEEVGLDMRDVGGEEYGFWKPDEDEGEDAAA